MASWRSSGEDERVEIDPPRARDVGVPDQIALAELPPKGRIGERIALPREAGPSIRAGMRHLVPNRRARTSPRARAGKPGAARRARALCESQRRAGSAAGCPAAGTRRAQHVPGRRTRPARQPKKATVKEKIGRHEKGRGSRPAVQRRRIPPSVPRFRSGRGPSKRVMRPQRNWPYTTKTPSERQYMVPSRDPRVRDEEHPGDHKHCREPGDPSAQDERVVAPRPPRVRGPDDDPDGHQRRGVSGRPSCRRHHARKSGARGRASRAACADIVLPMRARGFECRYPRRARLSPTPRTPHP